MTILPIHMSTLQMVADFLGSYDILWFILYYYSFNPLWKFKAYVERQRRRKQYLLFVGVILIDVLMYFFGTKTQRLYVGVMLNWRFYVDLIQMYILFLSLFSYLILMFVTYTNPNPIDRLEPIHYQIYRLADR